jgi:D-3-phosphoglycerate dehydrogenase
MRPRLLIAEPDRFSQSALESLQQWSEVVLRNIKTFELVDAFHSFDIIWIRLGHHIRENMLSNHIRCRILAIPVTGLNHIDLQACLSAGIQVVSLKGETGFLMDIRATAELTIGLTLTLLRHIPEASRSVQEGIWDRNSFPGRELFQKTAGIIGMGRLGTIVAGYFKAFGMKVVGYDPFASFSENLAKPMACMETLLETADVVSVHVDYHPGTHNLLNRDKLSLMKPESVLINTSRGGIIDEEALLQGLRNGTPGAAALDVLNGEPLIDASHPMVEYARANTNLIITPHIGGNTPESFQKTEFFIAKKVRQEWHRIVNPN